GKPSISASVGKTQEERKDHGAKSQAHSSRKKTNRQRPARIGLFNLIAQKGRDVTKLIDAGK
ncbi:MAG: hypothetical protein LBT09_15790, partial [Planctomycetaceae bacterium]|nr:hypothetical protein [Planctomycetaceae bacterium]